jgi:hypothetical protein
LFPILKTIYTVYWTNIKRQQNEQFKWHHRDFKYIFQNLLWFYETKGINEYVCGAFWYG